MLRVYPRANSASNHKETRSGADQPAPSLFIAFLYACALGALLWPCAESRPHPHSALGEADCGAARIAPGGWHGHIGGINPRRFDLLTHGRRAPNHLFGQRTVLFHLPIDRTPIQNLTETLRRLTDIRRFVADKYGGQMRQRLGVIQFRQVGSRLVRAAAVSRPRADGAPRRLSPCWRARSAGCGSHRSADVRPSRS